MDKGRVRTCVHPASEVCSVKCIFFSSGKLTVSRPAQEKRKLMITYISSEIYTLSLYLLFNIKMS